MELLDSPIDRTGISARFLSGVLAGGGDSGFVAVAVAGGFGGGVEFEFEGLDDDAAGVGVGEVVGVEDEVVVEGVVDVLSEVFENVVLASAVAAGDFAGGLGGGEFVDAGEIADADLKGSDEAHMERVGDVARDEIPAAADDHGVSCLGEAEDGLCGFCNA